ncbi:MAG: flagellar hook-associated protein FlgK [Pseudomonadota bacterium]
MSISTALNAALSGLAASSRMASTVANNVSNANTEGYGVRTVVTGSIIAGGDGVGTRVVAIERNSDPILTGNRRLADADLGRASAAADFFARLEQLLGTPEDGGSLAGRLDQFESSLVTAANSPESDAALNGVVFAADAVADRLNTVADGIQIARQEADAEINTAVTLINNTLVELESLNEQLVRTRGFGGNGNALLDQQQILVDRIAEYIPVREYRDQSGRLRLFSTDGVKLLDGNPATLEFSRSSIITPEMTVGVQLGDLTIDGSTIPMSGGEPGLTGGRLRALFDVRDTYAVDAQTKLDAVARDLAERFEAPALDPTRAPTDPGLFTDQGAITDPLNELGLSQRLSVNALVDPSRGGEVFRIRDGLGAAGPGQVGDATLLQGMSDALSNGRVTVSGGFSAAERSMTVLGGELLSVFSGERQFSETNQTFSAARQQGLLEAELEQGVNTDAELQRLILIEQIYQANARVIQVVNDMLEELQRSIG